MGPGAMSNKPTVTASAGLTVLLGITPTGGLTVLLTSPTTLTTPQAKRNSKERTGLASTNSTVTAKANGTTATPTFLIALPTPTFAGTSLRESAASQTTPSRASATTLTTSTTSSPELPPMRQPTETSIPSLMAQATSLTTPPRSPPNTPPRPETLRAALQWQGEQFLRGRSAGKERVLVQSTATCGNVHQWCQTLNRDQRRMQHIRNAVGTFFVRLQPVDGTT